MAIVFDPKTSLQLADWRSAGCRLSRFGSDANGSPVDEEVSLYVGSMSSLPEIVSAVAVTVTAIVAVVSIRQSRADSKNRARPYISARFVEDMNTSRAFLVVENFGSSSAYNVTIDFDNSLSENEPTANDFGSYIRKMYTPPGITFGPGESRRSLYKHMNESDRDKDEVVAPDKLKGIVRYFGPERQNQYAEWIVLDLTGIRYRYDVTSASSDVEQRLKTIGKAIVDLRESQSTGWGLIEDIRNAIQMHFHPEAISDRKQKEASKIAQHERNVETVKRAAGSRSPDDSI